MRNITIGADPELFVKDENGKPHHCIGILGGDKWNPVPVGKGAVQEDNVAFEFNIDPATSVEEFSVNIDTVISQGIEMLPKGYTLYSKASHSFKDIDTFPESAWIFGCDPDFNAYTGERNPRPNAKDKALRSFGGHIHIGWDDVIIDEESQRSVVLACDVLLGLWSVTVDKDKQRRKLYGKASAYRPKPFGVEYRTLSNFWVMDLNYRCMAFNLAVKAADYNDFDKVYQLIQGITTFDEVIKVINTGNAKKAKEIHDKILVRAFG